MQVFFSGEMFPYRENLSDQSGQIRCVLQRSQIPGFSPVAQVASSPSRDNFSPTSAGTADGEILLVKGFLYQIISSSHTSVPAISEFIQTNESAPQSTVQQYKYNETLQRILEQ